MAYTLWGGYFGASRNGLNRHSGIALGLQEPPRSFDNALARVSRLALAD